MLDNMPSNYIKNLKDVITNQKRSPWGCVMVGCLEFILESTFFDVKDLVQAYFAANRLQQNKVFHVAQITLMSLPLGYIGYDITL
jgi:hypothetical protein